MKISNGLNPIGFDKGEKTGEKEKDLADYIAPAAVLPWNGHLSCWSGEKKGQHTAGDHGGR